MNPDPIDASALRAALGGRGGELLYFEETGSTNTEAATLGRLGVPRALVVADRQRAGRGRLGRSWESPAGQNLTFSMLLRPECRPQDAPLLCLAAGVAVAEVLDLELKWPNDVLSPEGRKLCGLLAETNFRGSELDFVVLGVGINVHQVGFPPELPNASSLAELGRARPRGALLVELVAALEDTLQAAIVQPAGVLARWRRRSQTLGRRVRVGELEGVAEDIRADGALILRTGEGPRVVLAGDVEMIGSV
ncbi:MAG: biotin--[acetyl-CoA-carboxylase] ligase [Alphaproteobacteria bacterium]|nr:biotin--[acetyl-CoA-carboxylase] ligase [Alphaproteobacteria bacterium]MCB9791788.1 biotin--[acetyl-CoA-carboxylase] ligase [Alphaproteobacteria bacterium]